MDYHYSRFIEPINTQRSEAWKLSHDETLELTKRAGHWFEHKALTIISFPINALLTGVSVIGACTSACTIGAFKAFVFAASLGTYELPVQTGFQYFVKNGEGSAYHLFENSIELLGDGCYAIYDTVQTVRWISRQIYLDKLVDAVFTRIGEALEVIFKKLEKGCDLAAKSEKSLVFETVKFFKPLQDYTYKYHIKNSTDERQISDIAAHTALCLINIPANLLVVATTAVAFPILGSFFLFKMAFSTLTGKEIPVASYANVTLGYGLKSFCNIIEGSYGIVFDGFVVTYKIAEACKIHEAVRTALEMVGQIPRLVFGS
jgi:hypothetical protein